MSEQTEVYEFVVKITAEAVNDRERQARSLARHVLRFTQLNFHDAQVIYEGKVLKKIDLDHEIAAGEA